MLLKFGAQDLISQEREDKNLLTHRDEMDNFTKKIHSKNTAVAVFTLGKLNRILQELSAPDHKLMDFEKRLLAGFYQTIDEQKQTNETGPSTVLDNFQLGHDNQKSNSGQANNNLKLKILSPKSSSSQSFEDVSDSLE